MAKLKTQYVCQDCGTWHLKWAGKCSGCQAWNTLAEEVIEATQQKRTTTARSIEFCDIDSTSPTPDRYTSSLQEFDRVTGGGLVPGSVLLVGGDPGIGKSTLLLQIVSLLAAYYPVAYISGEESVDQVRMRAKRLGIGKGRENIHLAAATNVSHILKGLEGIDGLKVAIIDSIQTMASDEIDSSPGTVSQVKASAHEIITFAKKHGVVMIIVGHVTKEGAIAGPRVLEHMVDTVLYFEGDRNYQFRILRAVKNRYGATDEIGVFEMRQEGLREVTNPSALFLEDHQDQVSGNAIFAGIEGTRPILTEVQALVSPSFLASPRRTTVGWDQSRLAMILAVLEARCGQTFSNKDVYLNIAGGLKITEPAADLAVAAALMSALKNIPLPSQSVFFGEVGLAGEVRGASQMEARLKESEKLGFKKAFLAKRNQKDLTAGNLEILTLNYVIDLTAQFKKGKG